MHDVFMKVPRAAGSCTDENHVEWIELVGVEWSAKRPQNVHGVQRIGPLEFRNVTVLKRIDKSSVPLFRHMCVNSNLEEVEIEFVRTGLNDIVELKATLRNAGIIGIDFTAAGSGPDAETLERVTIQFEEFEHAYTPVARNGDPQGTLLAIHRLSTNVTS